MRIHRAPREPVPLARWWTPRGDDEPVTAVFLGRVLDELGAHALAAQARNGWFDDFEAPAGAPLAPQMTLAFEVERWGRKTNRVARLRAQVVVEAVKRGEFDATPAEARRWAASKDGQDSMAALGVFGGEPDGKLGKVFLTERCTECGALASVIDGAAGKSFVGVRHRASCSLAGA